MSRRKGRRLAVALPPRWPRWGTLLLSTLVTLLFAGLGIAYFWTGGSDPNHFRPERYWILGLLIGLPGLLAVVYWVRDAAIWLVAGETRVEIGREPALAGSPLDVFIVQSRDHSALLRLEARIVCRRTIGRRDPEELVSIPLGDTAADRQGRSARLECRVEIPADALPSEILPALKIEWAVEVKAYFRVRRVFRDDHPFEVAAAGKA